MRHYRLGSRGAGLGLAPGRLLGSGAASKSVTSSRMQPSGDDTLTCLMVMCWWFLLRLERQERAGWA